MLEDTSQTPKITIDSAEMIVDEVAQTKKMIETFMTNYNRQNQLGTLTSDQEAFNHKVEDLKQSIVSIRLLKSTEKMINISLWDCNGQDINTIEGCCYSDNLNEKIKSLDDF